MPLFEYHCHECRKDAELLLRRHDEKPSCPHCGSPKMEKLLSAIGAPIISDQPRSQSRADGETCGRPQCGRGCMFDN
jgi:putative FmdB family regulatory protein